MGIIGSLFGAGIGWWLLGPIGALLGSFLGSSIENNSSGSYRRTKVTGGSANPRDGFIASLLVLMAATMKADGKVLKSELDYVKQNLERNFGENASIEALLLLRKILKQDIPLQDVLSQVRRHMDYASRLELIHLLYGIGVADGHLSQAEVSVIDRIAYGLGISTGDQISIKNLFYDNLDSAYKVLEIDKTATNEEMKKAYHKMAIRFHPDKVAHLGSEVQKGAKERFQKLNEAYEKIKRERGMK